MNEPKRKKDYTGCFFAAFFLTIIGSGLFVGFVKFMAWWRIAFGDMS